MKHVLSFVSATSSPTHNLACSLQDCQYTPQTIYSCSTSFAQSIRPPITSSEIAYAQVRLLSPETSGYGNEDPARKGQITNLLVSPDGKHVAAGYSSGLLIVFHLQTGSTTVSLHGHKAAVTAGRYEPSSALFASGSADTDIVIWDMVAESGLYRLKGHRDGVTDVAFLSVKGEAGPGPEAGDRRLPNGLASCSKDTLVKIWDLDTQSCVQTVVGHRGEVRYNIVCSPCMK